MAYPNERRNTKSHDVKGKKVNTRDDLKIENVVIMKPRSVMVDPDSTSEEKVYATGEIEQRRGGQAWSIPAPTMKAADTSYDPPNGVSVVPPRWKDSSKE